MNNSLTDAQLLRMTLDDINNGLRSYRPDLRYTRDDARRFAQLWNAHKIATVATVADVDGVPCVVVVQA